ncbi:MAG: NRDE family protein, partial [Gammaproteobacteria bacterium]|nr:NRDE family protein [Gammaproteobacteria bacterium]
GVSRAGRIAIVTNYREMAPSQAGNHSRGGLVTAYLAEGDTFLNRLNNEPEKYSGYNLIAGRLPSGPLHYYSNRTAPREIDDGVHGISNHELDTPWPKLGRTVSRLRQLLQPEEILAEDLLELLADRTPSPVDDLPDTGLPHNMEHLLSAPFVVSPDYGTRCSTIVLLGHDNHLQFIERRFDRTGEPTDESHFAFNL